MTSVAELIPVPFAGMGAGTDELSWGQQNIWNTILKWGPLNVVGSMPVPPTTTVEDLVRLLSFVSSRHPSLRTRFHVGGDGRPRQEVFASGETVLEVIDVETVDPVELSERYRSSPFAGDAGLAMADPTRPSLDEVAIAVRMRFYDRFDEAAEWPVRMTVIRQGGVVTQVVVGYNHLVIDGEGLTALVRDLATMAQPTGVDGVAPSDLPPLEQVRLQRTPQHRKNSDAALQHWGKVLRAIPAARFASPVPPQPSRYWELEFNSPAAYLAIRAITARGDLRTGPTLLAAFSVALNRVTGISPSVAQVLVNNRFRPGFAESVSPLNQPGLCVVDVAGLPFEQVVANAWRATVAVGKHAYYDMAEFTDLVATIGQERGEEIDLSCFYSDRGVALRQEDTGPIPTPDDVRAALPRTELRWRRRKDQPNDKLFLHIGDTPQTIDLMLAADTMYLPPEDLTRLAREIEAVLVEAALAAEEVVGATPALT